MNKHIASAYVADTARRANQTKAQPAEVFISVGLADITIGVVGPDWADHGPFYAQRGEGTFAFGRTESEALDALHLAEQDEG